MNYPLPENGALTATELISEASESMLCGINDAIECVFCLSINLDMLYSYILSCFFAEWQRGQLHALNTLPPSP